LSLNLGLPLAAAIFRSARLLLYTICFCLSFCLSFCSVSGVSAGPAILFINLLPPNALCLRLSVGSCRSFLLAQCLRPQGIALGLFNNIVRVASEEAGAHDGFLNEEPNTACGNA
jgi:hypothetical protein